jgi:hypothetical protein
MSEKPGRGEKGIGEKEKKGIGEKEKRRKRGEKGRKGEKINRELIFFRNNFSLKSSLDFPPLNRL